MTKHQIRAKALALASSTIKKRLTKQGWKICCFKKVEIECVALELVNTRPQYLNLAKAHLTRMAK